MGAGWISGTLCLFEYSENVVDEVDSGYSRDRIDAVMTNMWEIETGILCVCQVWKAVLWH